MKSYSEKLKDPRWQRLRLSIFQRDNFTCTVCGDSNETLHAHHVTYLDGLDPWEYPDRMIRTFCEVCHSLEHKYQKRVNSDLIRILDMCGYNLTRKIYLITAFNLVYKELSLKNQPTPERVIFTAFEASQKDMDITDKLFLDYYRKLQKT